MYVHARCAKSRPTLYVRRDDFLVFRKADRNNLSGSCLALAVRVQGGEGLDGNSDRVMPCGYNLISSLSYIDVVELTRMSIIPHHSSL